MSSLLNGDFQSFCDPVPEQGGKKIKKEYSWDDIKRIETRRRKILKLTELPFWQILRNWDGTCLKALYSDWLLWLTLAIYCIIRVQARFAEVVPGFVEDLGNTDIGVIGGFLSFFLVLFVNQSNSRFNDMFKTSMSCSDRIFTITSLVNTTFPKARAHRIVRYLNAAHVVGYVGLSHTYSKRAFFNPLNDKYKFLTPQELKRIDNLDMDTGIDAFHEILEWCMRDVQVACKLKYVDSREAGVLKDKIAGFRGSMGTLYDYSDQPIHFFYIHFLCVLSAFYLPLFAVDNAYNAGNGMHMHLSGDILSGFIVLLQSIFVIGLRLLGQKMVDPYGDDLEDLSVLYYVESAWETSMKILSSEFPDDGDSLDSDEENNNHSSTSTESRFLMSSMNRTSTQESSSSIV